MYCMHTHIYTPNAWVGKRVLGTPGPRGDSVQESRGTWTEMCLSPFKVRGIRRRKA